MKKFLTVAAIFLSRVCIAETPTLLTNMDEISELRPVLAQLQSLAEKKQVYRPMLNFLYYKLGYCKSCSSDEVSSKMQAEQEALQKIDKALFERLNTPEILALHQYEIDRVFKSAESEMPISNIATMMTGQDVLARKIFISCFSYTKGFLQLAKDMGISIRAFHFVYLMDSKAFFEMCPNSDCSNPKGPRPFVHTVVVYEKNRKYYLINTESQGREEVVDLGKSLPERLGLTVSFPNIKVKDLVVAGVGPAEDYMKEFPWDEVISIIKEGRKPNHNCRIDPPSF